MALSITIKAAKYNSKYLGSNLQIGTSRPNGTLSAQHNTYSHQKNPTPEALTSPSYSTNPY